MNATIPSRQHTLSPYKEPQGKGLNALIVERSSGNVSIAGIKDNIISLPLFALFYQKPAFDFRYRILKT